MTCCGFLRDGKVAGRPTKGLHVALRTAAVQLTVAPGMVPAGWGPMRMQTGHALLSHIY